VAKNAGYEMRYDGYDGYAVMMDALQEGGLRGFFGYGGCAFGASTAFNTEMIVLRIGVYYHFFISFL
jgi:hypothetical protein